MQSGPQPVLRATRPARGWERDHMTTSTAEGVGFRSERGPVLIALMLSTGLVAIDCDGCGDGRAFDRARHWRVRVVPLAVLRLPARPGRVGAGLREALRHHRPQADHADRNRPVPARLDPLRSCLEHAGPHRLPRGPGPGRRSGPADGRHHRRRHLHGGRARQGAGLPRERVGGLLGGGPDARRGVCRTRHLARHLLREHPAVPGGRMDAGPVVPREHRAA